ncbi:leucine-rich repeat receptor protein CLAVATA2 [Biomphalaria glabrata]|nr:leucine-rich repeat receptor protein CLAVATA2 [Biomphalaria glabrata]
MVIALSVILSLTVFCTYASLEIDSVKVGSSETDDSESNKYVSFQRKGKFQHKGLHQKTKLLKDVPKKVSNESVFVIVDSVCFQYDLTINCSNLQLKEINSSWFPNSTEIILLNDNLLTTLSNSTFSVLIHLTYLDISNNRISNIGILAFEGLSSLKYLNLSYNEISFVGVSENILKPLKNLKYLDLIQDVNTQTSDAPGSVLQTLTKLTNLSISSVSYILCFGPEFLNLTNLEVLTITGSTRNITEASFENVNKLKELVLRDMMSINFMHHKITNDAFINRTVWNHCLRHVVISENPLMGSSISLFPLAFLQNLSTVVVNNAIPACRWVWLPPSLLLNDNYADEYHSVKEWLFHENMMKRKEKTFEMNPLVAGAKSSDDELLVFLNNTLYIDVSKKLNSWNSKRLIPYLQLVWNTTLRGADNFQYLDISESGFQKFVGHFQGFSSLKTLIVSGNDVSILSEYFFDGFFGLQKLALSNCKLDKNFFAIKSDRVFLNTTILKELDLSYNFLNDLSRKTFSRNTELTHLDLSGNQFKDIPFNLEFTPNLKYLDMSNNVITTLTFEATGALDFQSLKNKGFQLMLNGNILSCGCHDLSFLQWLNSTLVRLDNNRNYTCMNKDGERTNTLTFSDLESLWRQCWGELFFYIALITLCLYVTGAVLIFLMLKNKNFLVSYFLQILGNFKLHARSDYKTDVYIGYSDEDYRFPCNDLRELLENDFQLSTFIADRDLLASLDKASGIMDAINSCWRVLLVCSKSFLEDEDWSMFTMRSAMYAQSPANPARIVLMVHRSCLALLPTELLSVVNDDNIILVSEWRINYILSEKLRTRLMA